MEERLRQGWGQNLGDSGSGMSWGQSVLELSHRPRKGMAWEVYRGQGVSVLLQPSSEMSPIPGLICDGLFIFRFSA